MCNVKYSFCLCFLFRIASSTAVRFLFACAGVINADVGISAVLKEEAVGNRADKLETEPLIQMTCVNITRHYGVKLHKLKAFRSGLLQTVRHELFPYMHSSA